MTVIPAVALASPAHSAAPQPSPAADSAWTPSASRIQASLAGHERRVDPSAYKGYTLDAAAMADALSGAPSEKAKGATGAQIQIPAPDGDLVTFDVVSSPIMEPGLAASHPEIQTYAGRSQDGKASVRLDVTPMGFHAYVRGARGGDAWFVDPAYNGDDSLYVSYLGTDVPAPDRGFVEAEADEALERVGGQQAGEPAGGDVSLRTYRLALVSDPSYANYFGTTNVLAEKVTLMNRVDEVYNDDLAIRMILIDDSDKLNLDTTAKATGTNGPCGAAACFSAANIAGCSSLGAIRTALGQLVGADKYDIGHLALGVNGGGVASLGVVGGNNKAQGCTGIPTPEGDYYAVDYVAHEMGHQFSGNHTFNGTRVNCSSSNRNGTTSVEPGSGTSVMAYAGICGQDNLQPHSDPYFSQRSQTEITTYVTSARPAINEVQTVSLYSFDNTDSVTLTFKGETTAPIAAGSTAVQVDAALEALPSIGTNGVAAVGYGGQSTPAALTNGIQVTFNGSTTATTPSTVQTAGLDQPLLTVTPVSGDVTGFVGTTAQGGPIQNGGLTVVPNGDHAPVVTPPATKTIPIRTPFTLTGSGTDADNDSLIYLWEQNDIAPNDTRTGGVTTPGGTALVSQTKTNGPLFRVFGTYANVTPAGTVMTHSPGENLAGGSPSRTFPDMDQILANNTNADTGLCPAAPAIPTPETSATNVPVSTVECFAEFLPTADYVGYTPTGGTGNSEPSLDFRLTARDLDPNGGGYAYGDTKLLLDKTTGPFLVSSRNTSPSAAVGTRSETITWTANTAALAPNVKISLSIDGGHSFPYSLADNTPNDGSQLITWPNVGTDHARIKIEAVDNYFFDVNNLDFPIVAQAVPAVPDTTAPDTSVTSGPANGSVLTGSSTSFVLASTESPATFVCTVDETAVPCSNGTATLTGLVEGPHTFTAAARDAAGNVDPTPVVRKLGVPVDDRSLTVVRGSWKAKQKNGAYLGTTSVAKKSGAILGYNVLRASSIGVMVDRTRKSGKLVVKLNGVKIGTVNLKGSGPATITVASFAAPTSGFLELVTKGKKRKAHEFSVDGVVLLP